MRILRNPVSRYPVIDGKASVELKLRTPRQLFDERDPAPFRDALIGATALVHDMTVVTRDLKDFQRFDGLDVLNPWS